MIARISVAAENRLALFRPLQQSWAGPRCDQTDRRSRDLWAQNAARRLDAVAEPICGCRQSARAGAYSLRPRAVRGDAEDARGLFFRVRSKFFARKASLSAPSSTVPIAPCCFSKPQTIPEVRLFWPARRAPHFEIFANRVGEIKTSNLYRKDDRSSGSSVILILPSRLLITKVYGIIKPIYVRDLSSRRSVDHIVFETMAYL